MTLENYIKVLTKLVQDNPNAGNYLVIYSADDEGNHFQPVQFHPTIGTYKWDGFDDSKSKDNNAVCIN